MTWLETLRTAYDSLRTRRLRSALTMLGILIGIAAVMLTVGLGQGAQKQVTDQINKLGSNLLIVTPGSTTSSSGVRGGRGSATTLTIDDAAVLADPSVAPDIARVAPTSGGSQSLVAGTTTWTSNVVATNAEWLGVRARSVAQGRFFTAAEVTSESSVAVLGSTTAAQLLGSTNAVGQTITVGGQNVTVIGVLNTEGSTTGGDQDDLVVMPLTTYASRLSTSANPRSVSTIYIEAKDATSLSAAYQETTNALLSAHGVTLATQDFSVSSQQAIVETATSTSRILTVLLGSIAAISLLVGGIGVMNIMLVSVTERIRDRSAQGSRGDPADHLASVPRRGQLAWARRWSGRPRAGHARRRDPAPIGQLPGCHLAGRRRRWARRLARHRHHRRRLSRQPRRAPGPHRSPSQ